MRGKPETSLMKQLRQQARHTNPNNIESYVTNTHKQAEQALVDPQWSSINIQPLRGTFEEFEPHNQYTEQNYDYQQLATAGDWVHTQQFDYYPSDELRVDQWMQDILNESINGLTLEEPKNSVESYVNMIA